MKVVQHAQWSREHLSTPFLHSLSLQSLLNTLKMLNIVLTASADRDGFRQPVRFKPGGAQMAHIVYQNSIAMLLSLLAS